MLFRPRNITRVTELKHQAERVGFATINRQGIA